MDNGTNPSSHHLSRPPVSSTVVPGKTNEDKYFSCSAEQMHGAPDTAERSQAHWLGKEKKETGLGRFCIPAPIN